MENKILITYGEIQAFLYFEVDGIIGSVKKQRDLCRKALDAAYESGDMETVDEFSTLVAKTSAVITMLNGAKRIFNLEEDTAI